MRIGLIAEPSKRELMQNFCVAYKLLLAKHTLYSTDMTARRIEEASGLNVTHYLPVDMGGIIQMYSQIERGELDALIFFYNPNEPMEEDQYVHAKSLKELVRMCDEYCIPVATNLASAELFILSIDRGDLERRM
jgi:methylglyoxal synthase